jgi:hypothetical protein
MDSEVGFHLIVNIIKAQNKVLLQQIAHDYDLDARLLQEQYLRPEYYLPIVQRHKPSTKPTKPSTKPDT